MQANLRCLFFFHPLCVSLSLFSFPFFFSFVLILVKADFNSLLCLKRILVFCSVISWRSICMIWVTVRNCIVIFVVFFKSPKLCVCFQQKSSSFHSFAEPTTDWLFYQLCILLFVFELIDITVGYYMCILSRCVFKCLFFLFFCLIFSARFFGSGDFVCLFVWWECECVLYVSVCVQFT